MSQLQWRSRTAAAVAGLCLASAAVIGTTTAAHAVPGQVTVTAISPPSSVDKSAVATCPAGTGLVGAGGQVVNGNGNVVVTAVVPNAALTNVTVTANEDNPFPGNWLVQAQAVCAPLATVPGRVLVSVGSPQNGTSAQLHTGAATCPAGLRVFGTGFAVSPGAAGNVTPVEVQPNAALTGATSGAAETRVFPPAWNWTTHLICGRPRPLMVRTAATLGPNSLATKAPVSPVCPPGTLLTGAGMLTSEIGGLGDIHLTGLSLTPTTATATGFEDPFTGTANNWSLTAFGACAS